jgi:hypothetical protein
MQIFWILLSALAVNAAALAIMFLYFRKLIRNTLGLDDVLDRVRTEVGGMIAELNQTADRNVSLLEDRIERAQSFMKSADKRFEAIARAGDERSRERDIFEKLSRARPLAQPVEPAREQAREPARDAPPYEPREGEAGKAPGKAEAPRGPEIRASEIPVNVGLTPSERAIRLWETGISSEIIASRLSMTVAEVDLIVAMEEQRRLLGK